jgi:hypothetical protein
MIDYSKAREAIAEARALRPLPADLPPVYSWTRYEGVVVPVLGFGDWKSKANPDGKYRMFDIWHEGQRKEVRAVDCVSIFNEFSPKEGNADGT